MLVSILDPVLNVSEIATCVHSTNYLKLQTPGTSCSGTAKILQFPVHAGNLTVDQFGSMYYQSLTTEGILSAGYFSKISMTDWASFITYCRREKKHDFIKGRTTSFLGLGFPVSLERASRFRFSSVGSTLESVLIGGYRYSKVVIFLGRPRLVGVGSMSPLSFLLRLPFSTL